MGTKRFPLVAAILATLPSLLPGATFTVTNTAGAGPGSLRLAVVQANSSPGPDTIVFAIPGTGPFVIQPSFAVATISDPLHIDGSSQAGTTATPLVVLDGTLLPGSTGLSLAADESTVTALEVRAFTTDIDVTGSSCTVQACNLGLAGTGIAVRGPGANLLGNTVSANTGDGVSVDGSLAAGLRIQGNSIGCGPTPADDLGNGGAGIRVHSDGPDADMDALIGGPAPGAGNTIKFNGGAGIAITGNVHGVELARNSIHNNDGRGIDLGDDGVTGNDYLDSDTGPNGLQNYPTPFYAFSDGAATTMTGYLEGAPSTILRLDAYHSDPQDTMGFGEGEIWVGETTCTVDPSGSAPFTVTIPGAIPPGRYAALTATTPDGSTSEFCNTVTVATTESRLYCSYATLDFGSRRLGAPSVPQGVYISNSGWDPLTFSSISITGPDAAVFSVSADLLPLGFGESKYAYVSFNPVTTGPRTATLRVESSDPASPVTEVTLTGDAWDETSPPGATLVVTNTDPSGPGSLDQAIQDANTLPGMNRIEFNIPGPGPHMIQGWGSMPAIADTVDLDASSQPGYTTAPLIVLDRPSATACLTLNSVGSTVSAFALRGDNASYGILDNGTSNVIRGCFFALSDDGSTTQGVPNYTCIQPGQGARIGGPNPGDRNVIAAAGSWGVIPQDGVTIQGNHIGTDASGTRNLAVPGSTSLAIFSSGTLVGGRTPAERNVIAGGYACVWVAGNSNTVTGNYLGVDATGGPALGAQVGVYMTGGSGSRVGGPLPGEGNVISGCYNGVEMQPGGQGTIVQGNLIGLDSTGTSAVPNLGYGISVRHADSVIGGPAPGEGNFVAACGVGGIGLSADPYAAPRSRIQGNVIGQAANGATAGMGCGWFGITAHSFDGTDSDCLIGGTAPGEGNIVTGNGRLVAYGGICVEGGARGVGILGNSIYGNFGPAIDLNRDGVTPNDPGDTDGGPNLRQNYPELRAAQSADGATTVTGTLNSTTSSLFRIELFATDTPDGTGFGEGRYFLGHLDVTTGADGNASFAAGLTTEVLHGRWVSATATGPDGSTSEMARSIKVGPARPVAGVAPNPLSFGSQPVGGGMTTRTVTVSNFGIAELQFTGAGLAIDGPDASDFSFDQAPSTAPLGLAQSATFVLAFAPSTTGTRQAVLSVSTSDPSQPLILVPLRGKGLGGSIRVGLYDGNGPGLSTIGAGGHYGTLKAACDAVNLAPLTGGDWTFEITGDLLETANSFLGQATNGNALIFRPAEGIQPVVDFTSMVNTGGFAGHWIIGIDPAKGQPDNLVPTSDVVIDGSPDDEMAVRNLTLRGPATAAGTVQHLVHVIGDSDRVKLRNLVLQSRYSGASSQYGAIWSQRYNPASGITTAIPDDGRITNCEIWSTSATAAQGVSLQISAASATPPQTVGIRGMRIGDNLIVARTRGLFFTNAHEVEVTGNTIQLNQSAAGINVFGLLLIDNGHPVTSPTITIQRNRFPQLHGAVNNALNGLSGIQIESAAPGAVFNIRNNMIGGLQLRGTGSPVAAFCNGINFTGSATATLNIDHNSISLLAPTAPYAVTPAAITASGASFAGALNVRNNIIRLDSTGLAIAVPSTSATVASNGNCIFRNGDLGSTGNLGGTLYTTLADWQAGTGLDAASISIDPATGANPPYTGKWVRNTTNTADLHFDLDPGQQFRGIDLPDVPVDLDGDVRPTTAPVMGADDFVNVPDPVIPPGVTGAYVLGDTGAIVEFTRNGSPDGGGLSAFRLDADPGGAITPATVTAPSGLPLQPNRVSPHRFWTVHNTGLTGFEYMVSVDISDLPGVTDPDALVILKRPDASSPWTPLNTTRLNQWLQASGLDSFSDFGIGTAGPSNPLPVSVSEMLFE